MKILIFLISVLGTFTVHAGWFSDDTDKLCYDWFGNREACSRTQPRRESLIAGQFNTYYGEETGSMVGSFSQGVVLSTVKSKNAVRFLFGGQLLFSSANSFINNSNEIPTTMLSADLILGASIKPFHDTYLKPVFEIAFVGGLKSIEFAGPPTGIEEKNLLPSYGGKLSVGIDIPLSKLYAIRPALDYQITRVDGLIDNESFVLDALGISLALVFQ
jgi:hypothetical protein